MRKCKVICQKMKKKGFIIADKKNRNLMFCKTVRKI